MKATFITQFDMFSDWFEEYKIPVLVAEKDDLEQSKLECLKLINKLNIGWSQDYIIKFYTIKDYDEGFFKLIDSVFPILISNKSLEKYGLKYLLEITIDSLEYHIKNGHELIKMKIDPK